MESNRSKFFLIITVVFLIFHSDLVTANSIPAVREMESWNEVRKEGVILQQHEYTCGAASLAMLFNVLSPEKKVTFTEKSLLKKAMEEVVPVEKENKVFLPALSLGDLERTSRAFGFYPVSLKPSTKNEARSVLDNLSPLIARVNPYEDYPHFVMIYRIKNEWVTIMDPAYGRYQMVFDRFVEAWRKGGFIFLTVSQHQFRGEKLEEGSVRLYRSREEKIKSLSTYNPRGLHYSTADHLTTLFHN